MKSDHCRFQLITTPEGPTPGPSAGCRARGSGEATTLGQDESPGPIILGGGELRVHLLNTWPRSVRNLRACCPLCGLSSRAAQAQHCWLPAERESGPGLCQVRY